MGSVPEPFWSRPDPGEAGNGRDPPPGPRAFICPEWLLGTAGHLVWHGLAEVYWRQGVPVVILRLTERPGFEPGVQV